MASNEGFSPFFKLVMTIFGVIIFSLFFLVLKNDKGIVQVKKPVATAKVVVKTGAANRVVRDLSATSDSNSNGPVMIEVDLSGLKNTVEGN